MFDISFGEIFIIVAAALIVIGPRQLPQTARFLGHLMGKIQRQVAGIKTDIRREMELEDLKNIQREYTEAAQQIGKDFTNQTNELQAAVDPSAVAGAPSAAAASDAAAAEQTMKTDISSAER